MILVNMINFIKLSLAVFRISLLLVTERGPFAIFERVREKFEVFEFEMPNGEIAKNSENELGKLFSCVWCMSIWVGVIVLAISKVKQIKKVREFVVDALSLSALAIIYKSFTDRV